MAEDVLKHAAVAPYLSVTDGAGAIAFYIAAFGAEETERFHYEGKVGHVTLLINGGQVMLSDEFIEYADVVGTKAPKTLGGSTVTINLTVDDVDLWFDRAIKAGGVSLRPPKDEFYGRQGKLRDPFGHVWGLVGPLTAAA
ncbi:MAG: VOC family protein [Caulobacteraceae bacterium]